MPRMPERPIGQAQAHQNSSQLLAVARVTRLVSPSDNFGVPVADESLVPLISEATQPVIMSTQAIEESHMSGFKSFENGCDLGSATMASRERSTEDGDDLASEGVLENEVDETGDSISSSAKTLTSCSTLSHILSDGQNKA